MIRFVLPNTMAVMLAVAACDGRPREARGAPPPPVERAARTRPGPARMERSAALARAWAAPRAAEGLSAALGAGSPHELAAAAMDARGVLHAVFAVDGDGDHRPDALEYARLEGDAWSAPRAVTPGMSLADAARVAVDGDGAVHVLWYGHTGTLSARDVPTDLLERVLKDGRWSAPRVLYHEPSRWGMGVRWLAAATDAKGEVQVLYAPQGRGFGHLSLRGRRVSGADYLDHDGNMMAWSTGPARAPLEFAYIGEAVSTQRRAAVNDVFVRAPRRGGGWGPRTEAYYGPARYSHYPQLVMDGRGVRHLFWLEDTDGSVQPEALFHSTSADGERWSAPRDLTPPPLRGGVLFRVAAAPGWDGRIHLLLRHSQPDGSRMGLYSITLRDGGATEVEPLAAPGDLGEGEAHLVRDPVRHRVTAVWRGGDGLYHWASRGE